MPPKRPPPPTSSNPWSRKRLRPRPSENTVSDPKPDRLSTLPTELLLLISGHLQPEVEVEERIERTRIFYEQHAAHAIPDRRTRYTEETITELRFRNHASLLALSRTCRVMHIIFSAELLQDLLRAGVDPLIVAVDKAHLPFAKRLLEEGHVVPAQEHLRYCMHLKRVNRAPQVREGEVERRMEVMRILTATGVWPRLCEEWFRSWRHESYVFHHQVF